MEMDVAPSLPPQPVEEGFTHVVIEPFYGGSHKQLLDGLLKSFFPDGSTLLLTLPPKKWKWCVFPFYSNAYTTFDQTHLT